MQPSKIDVAQLINIKYTEKYLLLYYSSVTTSALASVGEHLGRDVSENLS